MRNSALFDTKRYRRMITDCKVRVSEFYDWYDNNIRTEGIDGENIEESEVPEEVIEELFGDLSQIMNVKPSLEYLKHEDFNDGEGSLHGEYNPSKNIVFLPFCISNRPKDNIVSIIGHELYHAFQFCATSNPKKYPVFSSKTKKQWKFEFSNYENGENDTKKYFEQEIEKEARKFADTISKIVRKDQATVSNMSQKNKDVNISVVEYRNIIREMIKNENEIRNQRTNWFLILQGFLVAALFRDQKDTNLDCLIAGIGAVTSFSFWQAAWRSKLAVSFALACWKNKLNYKERTQLPPVSLIVKDILDSEESQTKENEWELEIKRLMFPKSEGKLTWLEKIRNKLDMFLPYIALPVMFLLFWFVLIFRKQLVMLFKNIYEHITSIFDCCFTCVNL